MADKTKEKLIEEIKLLQKRIAELEIRDSERKQQQQQDMRRLAAVVRDSNDAITIQDFEGRITAWNRGAERMYGYSEKEALQMGVWRLTPPGKVAEEKEFIRRLRAGEAVTSFETQRVAKDGRILDVWMTVTKLVDDTGKPVGIATTEHDITERKRGERTLQERERDYRLLADNIADFVWTVDMNLCFTSASPSVTHLLGYRPEEIINQNVAIVLAPSSLAKSLEIYKEEMAAEASGSADLSRSRVLELEHIRKDGSTVWTEAKASFLRDSDKKPIGILGVTRDITERKRAEEALRASQEYVRNIINSSLDMIIAVDGDRKIVEFNKAAQETFGYQLEEVLGKHVNMLYADPEEGYVVHKTTVENGRHVQEIQNKRKNGEVFPSLLAASVLRGSRGEIIGVMGVSRDITERKAFEECLLRSQKVEAAGFLAGGIAHGFNNFLTAIGGFVELALNALKPGDTVRLNLEEAQKAVEKASVLSGQLLAFSRKQVLQLKILDLNVVVVEMERMFQQVLGEKIKLVTILAPTLRKIRADRGKIEQVIVNLMFNARDAMPEGGSLTIKTGSVILDKAYCKIDPEARPGSFLCLSVADTGVGMDQATRNRLFEPFFTTKEEKGVGLGLSTAYGIIKQHGGWITVASEPGRGSTFAVYLPVVSEELEEEAGSRVPLSELQGHGERILVVEDEEAVRTFAKAALGGNGYSVFAASSAEEASEIFGRESGDFALLFSDVVLPGQNGLELAEQLRSHRPNMRILLTSGYTSPKAPLSAIREKRFRFLQKPYDLTTLLQAVKEVFST